MDPNAALKQIRDIILRMKRDHVRKHVSVEVDDLVDVVEGLDEWLSKGGFLPDDWVENRGMVLPGHER